MKQLLIFLLLFITVLTTPSVVFAQPMMGSAGPAATSSGPSGSPQVGTQSGVSPDNHTAREEQEGKELWKKLQDKQITCEKLSDEELGSLGEYFMGQMLAPSNAEGVGNSHEAMNTMMERMMGKENEEQMHVVMGKRLSGCDTSFQLPQNGVGFIPMMMNMRTGSAFAPWSLGGTRGGGNPMMGYGNFGNMMGGVGGLGFIVWLIVLIDLILLGVWLWKQIQRK